ncbi:MAG: ferredoxin--NADP reductase, partial [Chloroflexi bacterium]|nr:ferredoxin--NADP reductase [Chloroflexota bacterium]
FKFEPGQYATLGLLNEAGKLIQRPMSIGSPAFRLDEYEFFIRLVPEGQFTPLLWATEVGDSISIKGPKGKFVLLDDGRKCLFVSTGTGLAPFISMIDTLRHEGKSREIYLLHGASYDYDLGYRDYLLKIAAAGDFPLTYVPTVSRPQHCPDWTGCTGRVDAILEAQMQQFGLNADNTTIYTCGNPDMVINVENGAKRAGFHAEQVRKELYWPKGKKQ